jgi:hypothetical protein
MQPPSSSGFRRPAVLVPIALITGLLATGLACNTTPAPILPPGTPDCVTTCEMAWPCGATLENDLAQCIATCNDIEHEAYRACVYTVDCSVMADCKLYAPDPPPDDEG